MTGPREAAEERRLMGIVGGELAFMLEWTVTGDVFLTGAPALHASPWRALESWGESIRYLFSEIGLREMRMSLTPLRTAEVRALRALGCRRVKKEEDTTGEVWVWGMEKEDKHIGKGGRFNGRGLSYLPDSISP